MPLNLLPEHDCQTLVRNDIEESESSVCMLGRSHSSSWGYSFPPFNKSVTPGIALSVQSCLVLGVPRTRPYFLSHFSSTVPTVSAQTSLSSDCQVKEVPQSEQKPRWWPGEDGNFLNLGDESRGGWKRDNGTLRNWGSKVPIALRHMVPAQCAHRQCDSYS